MEQVGFEHRNQQKVLLILSPAIMISCVASFRQLFVASHEQLSPAPNRSLSLRFLNSKGSTPDLNDLGGKSKGSSHPDQGGKDLAPMSEIYVQGVVRNVPQDRNQPHPNRHMQSVEYTAV